MPRKKKPRKKLVDLFTHSIELEDFILSQYPGKLFENQHHVDTSEPERLYCFYNLNNKTLEEFLKGKNYEYEIRDSETGDYIFINKISQSIGPVNLN